MRISAFAKVFRRAMATRQKLLGETLGRQMRSLTLKFTLAFLFVSVVGVVLTAIFVRQRTKQEFDQFVLDRYQIDLLDDLSTYYRENSSWDEIGAIVVRTGSRYGRRAGAFPAPLTLTDVDGLVIYGGLRHTAGQALTEVELDRAAPVEVDDETVGWVLFAEFAGEEFNQAESPEARFLENVNQSVLFGALAAIGVALVIGIFLARTISGPVREVTAATHMVAGGDLGYQVPVRTRDELGELAASFNRMSADLARANQQRRQMTADIAHDLRTPLSVILGYMEALSTGRLEATPETFEIMYDRGRHLQHLIDDLRTLGLADAGELTLNRRPVEPAALLEHTALAHMVQAQEKGVTLRLEAAAHEPVAGQPVADLPEIEVDPERMTQVLGNLISNALRYTPPGGEIVLSAGRDEGAVLLSVRDTGAGIEAEDLPHIFDRFYRSDKSRQQNGESGLGLAIARSIVLAHDGEITAASTPGEGTTFTITISVP
jgi:signal transduction histidine kinase